jgi:signal transduction histidine kinase
MRRWSFRSERGSPVTLRRQIVVLTASVTSVVAILLVVVVGVVLEGSSTATVDRALADRTRTVATALVEADDARIEVPDEVLGPGVAVYDTDGQVVAGQASPLLAEDYERLSRTREPRSMSVDDTFRLHSEPVRSTSGDIVAVVVASELVSPYEENEHVALMVSIGAAVLLVLLGTGLVAWASRRALEPVAVMARTADEWSQHDLDRRFDLGPPTNEIRALGSTLDNLLERMANALRAEQRLTSELAHELRSPLTALQGTAELAARRHDLDDGLRADLDDILTSSRAMAATITELLELARAHDGARARSSRVLDAVSAVAAARPDGRIDVDVDPELRVAASLELVKRALAPVIDNGLRFGDGVDVRAEESGRDVLIRVADDGPGLTSSPTGDIFEPGFSADGRTGLGLPLARRVARSVGGDVTVGETSQRGAAFVVRLPAASTS